MPTITLSARPSDKGQISLDSALFCLECEIIFAGAVSCPRCTGQAVWPLADWVHPLRSGATVPKRENDLIDVSHSERW
jgi:hypothetical protein